MAQEAREQGAELVIGIPVMDLEAGANYNGLIGERAVGMAVLDHPQNVRHPTPWYVIRSNVMSYLNPALLTYEPLTIAAEKSLDLQDES